MMASTQETTRANEGMGERVTAAAARYLGARGYEIVERGWTYEGGGFDFVARDQDGALVFADVSYAFGVAEPFPRFDKDSVRMRVELGMASYLAETDVLDVPVRYDVIQLKVVGTDRAFIRHIENALA